MIFEIFGTIAIVAVMIFVAALALTGAAILVKLLMESWRLS